MPSSGIVLLTAPQDDLEATPPMPTDSQVAQWEQNFAQEIATLPSEGAKKREDEVNAQAKARHYPLPVYAVLHTL